MKNLIFIAPIAITAIAGNFQESVPVKYKEDRQKQYLSSSEDYSNKIGVNNNYIIPTQPSLYKKSIENRVLSFLQLTNNWDGYGACSIENDVINSTIKFINLIPVNILDRLTFENVRPTPYGTVVFDWENENEELVSVETGNKCTLGFFSQFNDSKNFRIDNVEFTNSLPNDLFLAFTKLY